MKKPLIGALLTASELHLLDHIAPLADLLHIPLLITTEEMFSLTSLYYPHVQKELMENLEFQFAELADRFDALIECKFFAPHLRQLFKDLYHKEMDLIFCPHGQSDKGYAAPLLAPYVLQDLVLLYGQRQITMLKEQNLWHLLHRHAVIGNYRLLYYRKYQKELDQLAEKQIFSQLSPRLPTLLYAPTWNDADQATSFFHWGKTISKELPTNWNVIVKVHPLLEQRNPAAYYAIAHQLQKKQNLILVSHFPLVYPILNRTDVYLGDRSSVGYDFLYFERPMFFFSHPSLPKGMLQTCGQVIHDKHPFSCLDTQNKSSFTKQQRQLYLEAFGHNIDEQQLQNSIYSPLTGRTNTCRKSLT